MKKEEVFPVEKNRKRIIGNGLLFAAILGLTLYGVFHGEDLSAVLAAIRNSSWAWLVPGLFCVVLFIWGEAVILWLLLRSGGWRLRLWRCGLISAVGFFFSAVTPSAGGGQPMQVYFLRREKIPVPISAVTLMAVTITYKLVLVIVGLALALFGRDFLYAHLGGAIALFWLGLTLTVGWVAVLLLLVFHQHLARALMERGLGLLERLRLLRHSESRRARLLASMAQYSETASYFKAHMGLTAGVLAITFVQRFALFTVPWLVYRSFGLTGGSWFQISLLQAMIAVSADMLPLPGGLGVSEALFLPAFDALFGQALLLPAMVLSRGLEFYCRLLISAAFTLVASIVLGNRKPQEKQRVKP